MLYRCPRFSTAYATTVSPALPTSSTSSSSNSCGTCISHAAISCSLAPTKQSSQQPSPLPSPSALAAQKHGTSSAAMHTHRKARSQDSAPGKVHRSRTPQTAPAPHPTFPALPSAHRPETSAHTPNPHPRALFDCFCISWVRCMQCAHPSLQPLGIQRIDGKRSMTALCASRAASQPRPCPTCRIGQRHIHNLHELRVARRQSHVHRIPNTRPPAAPPIPFVPSRAITASRDPSAHQEGSRFGSDFVRGRFALPPAHPRRPSCAVHPNAVVCPRGSCRARARTDPPHWVRPGNPQPCARLRARLP